MKKDEIDVKKNYTNTVIGLIAQITIAICSVLLIYFTFNEQILNGQHPLANVAKFILFVSLIASFFKIYKDFNCEPLSIYIDYLKLIQESEKQNKKLHQITESAIKLEKLMQFVLIFLVASKSRRAVEIYRSDKIFDVKKELNKYVKDFLFHHLREFFATSIGERFSVAIYLCDFERKILWDFLSKKSFLINPREDAGRDWDIDSAGHVAMCFKYQDEYIHADLQKAFAEIKEKNQNGLKASDNVNYKSGITLPLFFRRNNEEKEIAGVFCITSNHYNTFTDNNLEDSVYNSKIQALRIFADIIADNLALHYNNDVKSIHKLEIQRA